MHVVAFFYTHLWTYECRMLEYARKVSNICDIITRAHWVHALERESCFLLSSWREGHTLTLTFTGWLFIPQGHDVTISTSALDFL